MIAVKTLVDQQLATGEVIIVFDPINEEGVKQIIEKATPSLRTLILQGAFFGSVALMSFHQGSFNNLVTVELKNNEIGNQGCKYLSKCSFNSMRKFSLSSNILDAVGVMHLQKARWRTVFSFSLYNNGIGVLGMKLIGKCQFGQLESLCISKCDVSIAGLIALMGFQCSLKRLYMSISKDTYFEAVKTIDSAIDQKFPKLLDYNFA